MKTYVECEIPRAEKLYCQEKIGRAYWSRENTQTIMNFRVFETYGGKCYMGIEIIDKEVKKMKYTNIDGIEIDQFNEVIRDLGYYDNEVYTMDYLDELFQDGAREVMRAAFYGSRFVFPQDSFNPNDDYFFFDGYGDLVSIPDHCLQEYFNEFESEILEYVNRNEMELYGVEEDEDEDEDEEDLEKVLNAWRNVERGFKYRDKAVDKNGIRIIFPNGIYEINTEQVIYEIKTEQVYRNKKVFIMDVEKSLKAINTTVEYLKNRQIEGGEE